ncbi:hypothetical protein HOK68_01935 [Candidatus Woesearchaeota archaeon]|jgi:hypothetical protein|nr:hypothetical protein [Candidatus Woesearchaeota archaeon]MBT4387602.1 hypothetical protein [Candidatus Woesearchaeota archaeon]MBT4596036.1 hypothetical protein [Candidatus Woesearchaeota archaeon]MBT5740744.1 hypothetical protein [Candidatus Woesearchaeota archaeon]MBT6505520.1 hypothetical protein [Candidatus Woesearchaeota archaeon]
METERINLTKLLHQDLNFSFSQTETTTLSKAIKDENFYYMWAHNKPEVDIVTLSSEYDPNSLNLYRIHMLNLRPNMQLKNLSPYKKGEEALKFLMGYIGQKNTLN